jgi:hypothetical protein
MYFNCRSRSTNNWSYGGKRGVEINGKRFTLKNTRSCLSCFFAPSTKLWFFSFIRNPPPFYRIDMLILSLRSCELFQILRYLQVVLADCNDFHTGASLRAITIMCKWCYIKTLGNLDFILGPCNSINKLVIVYRSLAVNWSDRYTFMNIIAVGVEFIDMFAKMKSIMSLVYVTFSR